MMQLIMMYGAVLCVGVALVFQRVAADVADSAKEIVNRAATDTNVEYLPFLEQLRLELDKYQDSQQRLDIGYYLFTPSNPMHRYNIQPNRSSLANSPFDPKLDSKFIIHGYSVLLPIQSVFFDIKDELLKEGKYNVIVGDWTKYNQGNYLQASIYAVITGMEIAKLIKFLMENTGIRAQSIHIIGHSLGAQVAAYVGKLTKDLGRISGLDAAGPIFQFLPNTLRLYYTDAKFVDAMHTNGKLLASEGFGTLEPYGDLDFLPNGGSKQPGCGKNDTFLYTDKREQHANNRSTKISCSHDRAPYLFLESIRNCTFLSVLCSSYDDFKNGKCPFQGGITAKMGFQSQPNPALPKESKFYLTTKKSPPYCNNYNE